MNVYTIKEICNKYQITRQTFASWVNQGLKVIKINRMVRINEVDLEEFLNKKRK
jgi:predicted site-specific integrase-resolvase